MPTETSEFMSGAPRSTGPRYEAASSTCHICLRWQPAILALDTLVAAVRVIAVTSLAVQEDLRVGAGALH
ncbi:hypothetical protein [Cupriavidus basilensis]|uniref:hypothetical protein n=1 Tax=Cupriavidus basilensis TaxID=68895 RepID=UPI0039F69625